MTATSDATNHSSRVRPDPVDPLDRHRFPVDEWRLVETAYSAEDLGVTETLFAVGNGYLGMRGCPEEGRDTHSHGTFVNGFHETYPIHHAEEAYGLARVGQTIVNAPDTALIKLYVDDEPILLSVADLESYERSLDFADGMLRRELMWCTPSGKRVQMTSTRCVSFAERHLAVMTMEITVLDSDAPVVLSSQILNRQDGQDEYHVQAAAMGEGFDPRRSRTFDRRVLLPQYHYAEKGRLMLGYRCAESRMTIAVGAHHVLDTANEFTDRYFADDDSAKVVYRVNARAGQPIRLVKYAAYHTSRGVPVRELTDRVRRTLDRATEHGLMKIWKDHRDALTRFWEDSDVVVEGQPELQQAIRWNLFQLAQASMRAEGSGIPAKGVTALGYSGHYFWDTEVYVLPFLTYTNPRLARNALRFRHLMLPAARKRAAEVAQRGALFPWRTINGEEASAYYAAGTAQYHIDADISYAVSRYLHATGDVAFQLNQGAEILVETARMWADLGFWRSNGDRSFHIDSVTGPDEYTTVVNDNLFTNVMARFNLRKAAEYVRTMQQFWPKEYARLVSRLRLGEDEVATWEDCAQGMSIPFDEGMGIHPQDMHFLEREVWDLERTPTENFPLLLHYHPLVIYRFQVIKQADVVLAMFLQGSQFTSEQKRANFEYYDPITTGDSTLSAVVQSIIAAEVGHQELALSYFYAGLFVDLADRHRNTADGVHVASAGGVWSALVFGFAGMRDDNGLVTFDPRLPRTWNRLTFRIRVGGTRVRVELTADALSFAVEEGGEASFVVRGTRVDVGPDAPATVALADQGPRLPRFSLHPQMVGSQREDGTRINAAVPRAFDLEQFED
ncbi:glycoside hydrolase family 65 protein [Desertihabitans brevis]|uniref:Glycoside hydrolase family 65 protein n=1 Tax=Desertihabitans brevis TaxID=2268447 RepID=A0A367YTL9_9ACTN|nr:glycosyl hydrolase family 65 protein [Desertihabitans brevis]RCK69097.1 glycoside hydrolase family 65 protein [Desertihabitans brevis]